MWTSNKCLYQEQADCGCSVDSQWMCWFQEKGQTTWNPIQAGYPEGIWSHELELFDEDDVEDGFWSKMVKVDQTSHKFSGILYSDQQKTMWVFPIKQGFETRGPLSPFLFILAMEGLSNLFQIAKANGWIKGFKVGENTRNNLEITHLYLWISRY